MENVEDRSVNSENLSLKGEVLENARSKDKSSEDEHKKKKNYHRDYHQRIKWITTSLVIAILVPLILGTVFISCSGRAETSSEGELLIQAVTIVCMTVLTYSAIRALGQLIERH